jgi:hypothetical protein
MRAGRVPQTDMQALRRKSLALTDLFIALVEARCAGLSLDARHAARASPARLAGQLRASARLCVMQALIARGVIGDYREPTCALRLHAALYALRRRLGRRRHAARHPRHRRVEGARVRRARRGDLIRYARRAGPRHANLEKS